MDDLKHMLGAYFYELWDEHEYESWHAAVDDFVRRSPARAARVPVQIDELLAATGSDESLDSELLHMGCTFRAPDGSRDWLRAVRDRISNADQAIS